MNLFRALRSDSTPENDKQFVQRFLDEIERWCDRPYNRARFRDLGGLASEWRNRLEKRLWREPAVSREAARELLSEELFVPLLVAEGLRVPREELLNALLDELPELIVNAGDPHGAFRALRATFSADIRRLEDLIAELSPSRRDAGDRLLLAAYLGRLVSRLGVDNWTLGHGTGPARLDPVQQRLSLAVAPRDGWGQTESVDVDELVDRCQRLLILGGPGSGKSWCARRAVIRTACAALARMEVLDEDEGIAGLEVPLVATCAEVLGPGDHQPWDRLVAASVRRTATGPREGRRLEHILGDHQRFLIVLDGLDEVGTIATDAVRQLIDTQDASVRMVLTSRPGSWRPALLTLDDERHQVGTLEPFTSHERDAAVAAWLDDVPETRDRFLALVRSDSAIGRQTSVPLICALYCLIVRPDRHGSPDTVDLFAPDLSGALYDRAIRKLLAAPWRDHAGPPPTAPQILAAIVWLEELAETGNVTDEVTGLGRWPDAIVPVTDPDDAIRPYVDNVAPPDPYDDETAPTRRFVHRTLREHLTASVLRRLPPDQLAATIAQHLWSDPDWTEVIPTLLAGPADPSRIQSHDHDRLIELLLADPAVIADRTGALHRVLLEAAVRSRPQPALTPRRDRLIERAIEATLDGRPASWDELAGTAHWPATRAAAEHVFDALTRPGADLDSPFGELALARTLAALAPGSTLVQRAAEHLLGAFADPELSTSFNLGTALGALAAASPEPQAIADSILDRLVQPSPALDVDARWSLIRVLTKLAPTIPDPQAFADRLIETLTRETRPRVAARFAKLLDQVAPGGRHAQRGAEHLLRLIDHDEDPGPGPSPRAQTEVVRAIGLLAPSSAEAQRGIERLLHLVIDYDLDPDTAIDLAKAIHASAPASPNPTALAKLIVDALDTISPGRNPGLASVLAETLGDTAPRSPQAQRGAEILLDLLVHSALRLPVAGDLADAIRTLAPALADPHPIAEQLVDLLVHRNRDPWAAGSLATATAALAPGSVQVERCVEHLLGLATAGEFFLPGQHTKLVSALLPDTPDPSVLAEPVCALLLRPDVDPSIAAGLAGAVRCLASTMSNPDTLLDPIAVLLGNATNHEDTWNLARMLVALRPDSPQARQGVERLIDLVAAPAENPWPAQRLAAELPRLVTELRHPAAAIARVLDHITIDDAEPAAAGRLAELLAALAPTNSQAEQTAEHLIDLLDVPNHQPWARGDLARSLTALRPHMSYAAWRQLLADPSHPSP